MPIADRESKPMGLVIYYHVIAPVSCGLKGYSPLHLPHPDFHINIGVGSPWAIDLNLPSAQISIQTVCASVAHWLYALANI